MNFNKHSNLEGQHAFLGASNYHWINYDEEKIVDTYNKRMATLKGTELHELAAHLIRLGVKLPKSNKTLNAYVNDAIGFQMQPEQVLFYSENCFGTADTIDFNLKKRFLRIHDYKSGESPTSFNQLLIYMALFCLEYDYRPFDIEAELRLYQSDDVRVHIPEPEQVLNIMDKIIRFDKAIEKTKIGG